MTLSSVKLAVKVNRTLHKGRLSSRGKHGHRDAWGAKTGDRDALPSL